MWLCPGNPLQTEVKEHCSKFSYRRDVTCYRDEVDYENVFRTIYFYQSDISPKLFKKHKKQCMRALNACMKSAAYGKWPDEATLREFAENGFIRYVMGDTWAHKYLKRARALD